MDEDMFFAVITLLIICIISGVVFIYFILRLFETALWHAQMLLFAIVMFSGTISISSLIIALREVRNYHLNVP